MKVVVLGGTGLAGQALLREVSFRDYSALSVARRDADIILDLTDLIEVERFLETEQPDCIINAAALANVGECQKNTVESWIINTAVVGVLRHWSFEKNKRLVHISTDHFFTEGGSKQHSEKDPVRLVNVYSRQKYAAECISLSAPHALVLRTSIVGKRGWKEKTFAEWTMEALLSEDPFQMFSDVWTSSIDTKNFARAVFDLAEKPEVTGLFNVGAREVYSKADFIEEMARQSNISVNHGERTSHVGYLNRRACCLGLDVSKVQQILSWQLPNLTEVVRSISKGDHDVGLQHRI